LAVSCEEGNRKEKREKRKEKREKRKEKREEKKNIFEFGEQVKWRRR
jgi:hypothetical protein